MESSVVDPSPGKIDCILAVDDPGSKMDMAKTTSNVDGAIAQCCKASVPSNALESVNVGKLGLNSVISDISEENTNDSLTSAHDVELIDQLSEKSPIATLEPYVIATRQSNTSKSQNLIKTSSMDKNQRVLYCTKVDREVDYEFMYDELKSHGSIERIKMILDEDSNTYDAYVTFAMNSAALSALQAVKEIGNVPCKLLNAMNVADSACDFIPSKLGLCENKIKRESPPPVWFVAQYKEGLQNKALAALNLERKVGNID